MMISASIYYFIGFCKTVIFLILSLLLHFFFFKASILLGLFGDCKTQLLLGRQSHA